MIEAFGKSVIRAAGSSIGRQIIRGVMGSIFGGGGRRRWISDKPRSWPRMNTD